MSTVGQGATSSLHVAVGEAIRRRRVSLRLSQQGLGHAAGLDRTYLSGVERGVRNPTLATLERIASALGVRPSQLLVLAEEIEVRSRRGADRPTGSLTTVRPGS